MKAVLFKSFINYLKHSNSFRFLVFSFIILFASEPIFAQTKMWQNISNEPNSLGIKQIIPENYKILKLDILSMKLVLSKTPLEFTLAAKSTNTILELPMPDGKLEEFVILESPMMEAELAKQFPEIKTYSGYNLKNPSTTAQIDFTPKGFHAMVLSANGTFFIDPYNSGTIEY